MEVWKKTVLMIFGIILLFFSFVIIFMPNGIIKLNMKKKEMAESAATNANIKKENKQLYREVVRLKSDPLYLENVARKELGMIKDDEIIIRFHSENKLRDREATKK
jgi:cell division protein FtsB